MARGEQELGTIKQALLFLEKKEAKKLLFAGPMPVKTPMPQLKKVFCFFFPKKKPSSASEALKKVKQVLLFLKKKKQKNFYSLGPCW
jgi:hypothetical protein